jgi:hypothetical protein
MCAEESLAPEDEVPRLGLQLAGDRSVPCDTAEVGQANIAGCRRLRIDGLWRTRECTPSAPTSRSALSTVPSLSVAST